MFISMLLNIYAGGWLLGAVVQSEYKSALWYRAGVRASAAVFGLAFLLRAMSAFVVRCKLADFCEDAVKKYYAYALSGLLLPLLFGAWVTVLTGLPVYAFLNAGWAAAFFAYGLLILASFRYYRRRRFLFEHPSSEDLITPKTEG